MNTRKINKAKKNTEEAIMVAAEELFLEKGYLLATTTEIARRAGVTHAMLHYYFRTKEQIFLKVLDKNLHELFSSVRQSMSAERQSFWENLSAGVSMLLAFLNEHMQLAGLLYEVAKHSPDLLERYQENVTNLMCALGGHHKALLQHEIAEGKCNPVTFEQLFLDIVTLVFSTYMFLPAINQIARLGKAEMDALLKRRHEEILTLIYLRLYGKDSVKG